MNSKNQKIALISLALFGVLGILVITTNMSKTASIVSDNLRFKELGTEWEYTQGDGWEGKFSRKDLTQDTFAVKVHNPYRRSNSYYFDIKVISLKGRHITLRRENDMSGRGYVCLFIGTLSMDGKHIDGGTACPNLSTEHLLPWSAKIIK